MKNRLHVACIIMMVFLLSGCRGGRSEKPPIHLNPNMDIQSKFRAQSLPLTPPDGVVASGPRENTDTMPDLTRDMLLRGQERFAIYCAPCHDKAGSGKGMVVQRGFLPPPDLTSDRIVSYTHKGLFDVITDGIRTMPAYGKQIPVQDRWAIVAYVRALQKSQNASISDIPEAMRSDVK